MSIKIKTGVMNARSDGSLKNIDMLVGDTKANIEAINEIGNEKIESISKNWADAVIDIQENGAKEANSIEEKGRETLHNIPDDYTKLYGDVTELKQDIENMFDRSFIDKCVVLNGKGVSPTTNAVIDDSNYKLILIPKVLRLQLAGIVAPNMYPVKMLMLSDSLSYVNRNTTVYFANNNLRADNYEYLAISYPIDSEIDIQPLSYEDFTEGIKPDAARNAYRRSSNMLNNRMLSKLGSSTSAFSYDANRNCTNLFPATYGDVIYTQDMTTGTYMTMLDSSFNVLGRLNTSPYERNKYKYEVTRPNTAYVFFWCSKDDVDFSCDGIYFVKNNQNAFYEPYYVANNIPIHLEEQKIKSYNVETRYFGTVWSGLGDSLTADGSGGLYRNYVWNYFGLSDYVNCGIGGTRMSGNIANAMWQDSRINSLSLASRVVTIMAGTNDAPYVSVSEEEFTRDNHDINSFVGAYNVCISKILYKFLNIEGFYSDIDYSGITRVSEFVDVSKFRLVLITLPKMFGSENYLNKSELFAEYVKRIAKMWGLPCVDANSEMEMNSINKSLYWTHQTTPDWTHFNDKAHYNLAELIIAKAKEVEPLQ